MPTKPFVFNRLSTVGGSGKEPVETPSLSVADRHGQRIACVGLELDLAQAEHQSHHPGDLLFVRPAVAGESGLDFGRRVFVDLETGDRQRCHERATRLRENDERARVDPMIKGLEHRGLGLEALDQIAQVAGQPGQTDRQRQIPRQDDPSARHCSDPRAAPLDEAVAGEATAGVEPQDQGHADRSLGVGSEMAEVFGAARLDMGS